MYYSPNGQPSYQPPYQQAYQPYQPPYFQSFEPEKRELRKTSCGLGWAFVVALLSPLVLGLLGRIFLKTIGYESLGSNGFGGLSPVLYFLFSGAVYSLFLVVPFAIYLLIKHIPAAEVLPFGHVSVGTAVTCVFFGVAACMLSNIPANIIAAFIKAIGFSGNMPSEPKTDILSANIIYIIYVMIIPPFVEEFVFRGVILSRLRKFGDGFAIFGSALLFGMFHGNFIQIPFAFLVGLVFAFLVVRTGNLWITIIIHAINNGFSLLCEFLARYQSAGLATLVSNGAWLAFIILGIIALIIINVKYKEFFSTKRATFMPFSTRMGAMLGNPGIILALLYCVGNAVYALVKY
jgi:membrane protease YdiL (CAAX protease family)